MVEAPPISAAHRPVRIGIVGCGNVLGAYVQAAEPLRMLRQVEMVAACGRATQRARALEAGFQRFTTDFHEVVSAPDVDLVLVLASMKEHGLLARAALEAGKHVL